MVSVRLNQLLITFTTGALLLSSVHCEGNTGTEQETNHEAQVATYCTGPSQPQLTNAYMKPGGTWSPDPVQTSCLTDKLQILKLCQRLYPSKTINNIVESSHTERITFTRSDTRRSVTKWLKPYRCLESPFQSDALLVPSPCIFDHVHNASTCLESKIWNRTAVGACKKRGMNIKSYAVLLPCGVGLFTGVEFVCCPGQQNNPEANEYDAEYEDEYEDDDDEDDAESGEASTTSTTTTTTPQPTVDPYFRRYDSYNEHQNYLDAEERLESLHKTRITRVMDDWSKLEDRYQAMRESDPKGAEEFKKTVTLRFQKTVKSLEEEAGAERKQLQAVHGQRVQSHLNERKKEAMECYTRGLNERPQIPHRVRKCLERLMRALHKDRHHALAHYKHSQGIGRVGSGDSAHRDFTLERLGQISNTARESLNMLQRYPKLSTELRPLIEDYVLGLQGRDDPPGSLLTSTTDSDEALLDKLAGILVTKGTTTTTTTEATTVTTPSTSTTQATTTADEGVVVVLNEHLPATDESVPQGAELFQENEVQHSHSGIEEFQTEAKTFSIHREVYHRENKSVYLTMAFAGIAVFGAMVTGLVVLRRRNPRNQGFLAVGQSSGAADSSLHGNTPTTPEEKHVISMQVNGYENPTYKYFESK